MVKKYGIPKDLDRSIKDWNISCHVFYWAEEEKKTYPQIQQLLKEKFNLSIGRQAIINRKRRVKRHLEVKEA